MARPDKDRYYLDIAMKASARSTCLRRNYGAVIVNHDEIISTGYNGAPRGCKNCSETGICRRDQLGCAKGSGYEHCPAVHAEQNAIISAPRNEMMGATIYITGVDLTKSRIGDAIADPTPCMICQRLIINAGIKRIIGLEPTTGDVIDLSEMISPEIFMARLDTGK